MSAPKKREPWFKWFPADWRSEPRLRRVSRAARSLWMDMLGFMHEGEPYGFLIIGGAVIDTAEKLAPLTGDTVRETRKLLAELEAAGIPSRVGDAALPPDVVSLVPENVPYRTLFSRKMIRDFAKRTVASERGKTGGNPALSRGGGEKEDKPYNKVPLKGEVKGEDKPQKPEARSQKAESATAPSEPVPAREALLLLCSELGIDLQANPSRLSWPAQLATLRAEGFDLHKHLIPAARKARASGTVPNSLLYLRPAAAAIRGAQADAIATARVEPTDDRGWRTRLALYAELGDWRPQWGPKRGERGHLCPDEIWREFDTKERAA